MKRCEVDLGVAKIAFLEDEEAIAYWVLEQKVRGVGTLYSDDKIIIQSLRSPQIYIHRFGERELSHQLYIFLRGIDKKYDYQKDKIERAINDNLFELAKERVEYLYVNQARIRESIEENVLDKVLV